MRGLIGPSVLDYNARRIRATIQDESVPRYPGPMTEPKSERPPTLSSDPAAGRVMLAGRWTTDAIAAVEAELGALAWPSGRVATVDASGIVALDTGGALLIGRLLDALERQGGSPSVVGFDDYDRELLQLVTDRTPGRRPEAPAPAGTPMERAGRAAWDQVTETMALFAFFGEACMVLLASMRGVARIRWMSVARRVLDGGWNAMPIIGLLSFLIGVVIAYQGATQLRNYGADIFVVDLIALTQVRELGPLLVAIILSGRTGSAYTAQIGTMKVSAEIDALRTMGVDPIEVLVLPRILAMFIALPLLTVFADVVGIFGGMVMSLSMLDLSPNAFLQRIPQAVKDTSFLIGVCKTPVFALIVSVVGCFQGFQATKGADSVGERTTRSVVHSIFFVIVADAIFSIVFSRLGI